MSIDQAELPILLTFWISTYDSARHLSKSLLTSTDAVLSKVKLHFTLTKTTVLTF